jgi:hypothetical protein
MARLKITPRPAPDRFVYVGNLALEGLEPGGSFSLTYRVIFASNLGQGIESVADDKVELAGKDAAELLAEIKRLGIDRAVLRHYDAQNPDLSGELE